jgi:hypothetical protein
MIERIDKHDVYLVSSIPESSSDDYVNKQEKDRSAKKVKKMAVRRMKKSEG